MEVKTISIAPREAQWIEAQQFTVEEICRFARVNPNKVQHWLRTTFNNVAEANIEHVNDTMAPWLVRWEGEAERGWFTPPEGGGGCGTGGWLRSAFGRGGRRVPFAGGWAVSGHGLWVRR